jgi:membrane-associated phospholipid phosphatase
LKKLLSILKYSPEEEFGADRIGLLIILFNSLLYLICLFKGQNLPQLLMPVIISIIIISFTSSWVKLPAIYKFLINCFQTTFMGVSDYIFISHIDLAFGRLTRFDGVISQLDFFISKKPLALIIQDALEPFQMISTIFYDTVMISYILYFFIPFFGAWVCYRKLPQDKKFVIGEYGLIISCYYILNFSFYLLVPVSGPQFFLKDSFTKSIPFSPFGQMLYELVQTGQITYIDCFPSGHFGICFLVTMVLYRLNDPRYFLSGLVCFGVGCATIALRYHYLLDLVGSVFLAFFCLWVGAKLYPTDFHINNLREEK